MGRESGNRGTAQVKRIGIALILVLVLLVGAGVAATASFVSRVCEVQAADPVAAARIYETTMQRIEAREQTPPAQNGYEIIGESVQDCKRQTEFIDAWRPNKGRR